MGRARSKWKATPACLAEPGVRVTRVEKQVAGRRRSPEGAMEIIGAGNEWNLAEADQAKFSAENSDWLLAMGFTRHRAMGDAWLANLFCLEALLIPLRVLSVCKPVAPMPSFLQLACEGGSMLWRPAQLEFFEYAKWSKGSPRAAVEWGCL